MKTIIFTLFCLFIIVLTTNAQLLYGTTSAGGKNGGGTITTYDGTTQHLNAVKNFVVDGKEPFGSLVRAIDGKFYGMTYNGGAYNNGVIFSFDAATGTYNPLASFTGTNGAHPQGSLVQAVDGKLYGMTAEGGSSNMGVIFSIDPATSIIEKLHDFSGLDGNRPLGELIQASNGKLYGMTNNGGTSNGGVIFSFNPATATYTKLYNFDNASGTNPHGSLLQASDGKLYGTASSQGRYYFSGVIFSYDIQTATYTKLFSGDDESGYAPMGNLIQATDGKLYGLTRQGGNNDYGVIFSYNIATTTYAKLYNFDGPDGGFPEESLLEASDGNLYGMAQTVNNPFDIDTSVIFSFSPSTLTYTKVHQFTLREGGYSAGNLVQDDNGKLYGMTIGNIYFAGTIFSYDISTTGFNVIRSFGAITGGTAPYYSLCKASDGNLYGITASGGNNKQGVLFLYNPATSTSTTLHDFELSTGATPTGSVIQASDGKLYGMASGGKNSNGVIFSYNVTTHTYTSLYDFSYTTGGYPSGSLVQASDGKLYGTTTDGGKMGDGVLFSFDPATSAYKKLFDFGKENGVSPSGGLIQATDGKLYGTTKYGGNYKQGILFSFNLSGAVFTKLFDFTNPNGTQPNGQLVQATDGKLYGMTSAGGTKSVGVIFSYTPTTSTFTKLYNFDGANGANPQSSLLQASDGKLYGMTYAGGSYNYGVIFSYDPAATTGNFAKLADFNDSNGRAPYSSFVELSCTPTTFYKDGDGDGFGDVNHPSAVQSCIADSGYVADSTDCNDADSIIYPGAPELCDGKDNNCDGVTDENCSMMTLNIGNEIAFEGNSGTKPMNFKVTLSSTSTNTVTVDYTTVNSTAKAKEDYKAVKGTLTFAPGVKEQTITVFIKGDTKVEFPELFRVQLSNAVNAIVGNGSGTGITFNDDFKIGTNESEITAQSTQQNTISNQQRSVVAYPNPAKNVVSVRLSGYSSTVSLQLTSLQGKVLKTTNLQVKGNVSQQLNVADLASGTYFLIAKDATGHQQTVKLVVTH